MRNIFDGLGEGTVAIAMSSDAQYIATISTGEETQVKVATWSMYAHSTVAIVHGLFGLF